MSRGEWYRNTEWTAEIESEFYQRLKRARDKLQYLHIQAGFLAATHPDVALRLVDEFMALLATGKDDLGHIFLVHVHNTRAEAFATLGQLDAAFSAYEDAIDREREFPNVRSWAYIEYSKLVACETRLDLAPKALAILEERRDWAAFPRNRYDAFGSEALLLYSLGRKREARESALLALEAAAAEHSGFRKHPKLGLVEGMDDAFGTRIQAVAYAN